MDTLPFDECTMLSLETQQLGVCMSCAARRSLAWSRGHLPWLRCKLCRLGSLQTQESKRQGVQHVVPGSVQQEGPAWALPPNCYRGASALNRGTAPV